MVIVSPTCRTRGVRRGCCLNTFTVECGEAVAVFTWWEDDAGAGATRGLDGE